MCQYLQNLQASLMEELQITSRKHTCNKLCRCIKTKPENEKTNSYLSKFIFLNRNIHIGHFKCEDGAKLVLKGTRIAVQNAKLLNLIKRKQGTKL